MGTSWQTEARFRAELRDLRAQLAAMQSVVNAAEAVVRTPSSPEAIERLQDGLRHIPATKAVGRA
jgi:hypothetical protein